MVNKNPRHNRRGILFRFNPIFVSMLCFNIQQQLQQRGAFSRRSLLPLQQELRQQLGFFCFFSSFLFINAFAFSTFTFFSSFQTCFLLRLFGFFV